MKILVCIKQVLDSDIPLKFMPGSNSLEEYPSECYRMNRYDEYALEEALLLKDKNPGVLIHVASVGPERVDFAIKRALAKGADAGVRISCGSKPRTAFETASYLAGYARHESFDLILAGVMSEDAMQCQVGPLLAAALNLPCAVSIVKTDITPGATAIEVESELEGGIREKISITLPCVLTMQTGTATPRYPSLSNMMKARSKEIIVIAAETLAIQSPREAISGPEYPPAANKGTVIAGTTGEKAGRLLQILHERALL